MERAARSYFLALRASARFGRATKLRSAGKKMEAVRVARETLAILSHPHVIRSNPAEASVLSCATVLLEELARELKLPGASLQDIVATLHIIRGIGPGGELEEWIPYLEHRAQQPAGTTAA